MAPITHYNRNTQWALYKGEKILAMGTYEEIAKKMGLTDRALLYYQTRSYLEKRKGQKRGYNNYRVLVPIDGTPAEPVSSKYKWCPQCEDHYLKNSDNFYVNKNVKSGYSCYCQECTKAYQKEYYSRKKGEKRALDKE